MKGKRKLKIGIVCFPFYGGSGALATELSKKLAMRGHKIHIMSSSVPFRLIGPWQKNIFYHQIFNVDYPLFGKDSLEVLVLANKIVEITKLEKLDIIHAHYALPFALALVLAKQILKAQGVNVKIVTTLHGTDVSIFSEEPLIYDVFKYSLLQNDHLTTVSQYLADNAKINFDLAKKPQVIYNFVDLSVNSRKKSRELRSIFAQPEEKILIHISNFRAIKRIEDVIKIFYHVNKKYSSKLLLVGDGPEQGTAQRLVVKYGLVNKVHFMGTQTDVSKLLSVADILLLPSEMESFGLTALEAIHCRVPVVASNAGGIPEIIKDGEDGLLANIGDVKTMSNRAIELIENSYLRKKITENAYKKAKEKFDAKKIINEYENMYFNLLKNKNV